MKVAIFFQQSLFRMVYPCTPVIRTEQVDHCRMRSCHFCTAGWQSADCPHMIFKLGCDSPFDGVMSGVMGTRSRLIEWQLTSCWEEDFVGQNTFALDRCCSCN